jgi:hypothetical protein
MHAALQTPREVDNAVNKGEQRVVATAANVLTGVEVSTVLANDDRPSVNFLAREALDAQTLCAGVTTVLR